MPANLLEDLKVGQYLFKLRVPLSFIERMEKGNPQDPLLLQILPLGLEAIDTPGFSNDPLKEQVYNPLPGLLHKYYGRVLLITSGMCAVNCRYCFRRSFPYAENNPGKEGWSAVLQYIRTDASISEVILSGGDPLTLTDDSLQNLLLGLEAIPHVQTLRIHSRIPIVLPERIDSAFLNIFNHTRLNKILVLHCNHPNELNETVGQIFKNLKQDHFTLLNQSVLLRGINDHADTQIKLQHKLFHYGVLPYYLHLLDYVNGAAHFEVSLTHAEAIIEKMRTCLPGYLVPRLAREIPDRTSKTILL